LKQVGSFIKCSNDLRFSFWGGFFPPTQKKRVNSNTHTFVIGKFQQHHHRAPPSILEHEIHTQRARERHTQTKIRPLKNPSVVAALPAPLTSTLFFLEEEEGFLSGRCWCGRRSGGGLGPLSLGRGIGLSTAAGYDGIVAINFGLQTLLGLR